MRQCTVEYEQRLVDVALAAAQLVRLRICNTYELVSILPRVKHQWTLQVALEAQPDSCLPSGCALPNLIQQVRFGLKPAFVVQKVGLQEAADVKTDLQALRYVDVTCEPFQVTATSFASSSIPIIVEWQDWVGQPPLRLDHDLSFAHGGGSWEYGVDLTAALTGTPADDSTPARTGALAFIRTTTGLLPPSADSDTSSTSVSTSAFSAEAERECKSRRSHLSSAMKFVSKHLPSMRPPMSLTRRSNQRGR